MDAFQVTIFALCIVYWAICIAIGLKVRDKAGEGVESYFIMGKEMGLLLLLATYWASFNGAGNFVGYAGRAALHGVNTYILLIGEMAIGVAIFAFILVRWVAKESYMTLPQLIDEKFLGREPTVRRVTGVAQLLCNACWVGGQLMAVAYLFELLFAIPAGPMILVTGAVYLAYTYLGGLRAVAITDVFQGIIQLSLTGAAVFLVFSQLGQNGMAWLSDGLSRISPDLVSPFRYGFMPALSLMLVGVFGNMSNPLLWQRAFASKDVKTATTGFGIITVFQFLSVVLVATLGLIAVVHNPEVGDKATVWMFLNFFPKPVIGLMAIGVLGATMSVADAHTNAGASNVAIDLIDPYGKFDREARVRLARNSTLVVGAFAIIGAMVFPTIFDLAIFGYAVSGGVVIPLVLLGKYWADERGTRMTKVGAKWGSLLGIIVACLFELVPVLSGAVGGGVIPALVVTFVVTMAVSSATRSRSTTAVAD